MSESPRADDRLEPEGGAERSVRPRGSGDPDNGGAVPTLPVTPYPRGTNWPGYEWQNRMKAQHDCEDHWHPTSPHARASQYTGGSGFTNFGWWDPDNDEPERNSWQLYRNGGDPHRPAWENLVLAIVQSGIERRKAQERQEHVRQERAAEARRLHALREQIDQRAACEAAALRARLERRVGRDRIRSWHAPRTAEGWPEGVTPREEVA